MLFLSGKFLQRGYWVLTVVCSICKKRQEITKRCIFYELRGQVQVNERGCSQMPLNSTLQYTILITICIWISTGGNVLMFTFSSTEYLSAVWIQKMQEHVVKKKSNANNIFTFFIFPIHVMWLIKRKRGWGAGIHFEVTLLWPPKTKMLFV